MSKRDRERQIEGQRDTERDGDVGRVCVTDTGDKQLKLAGFTVLELAKI